MPISTQVTTNNVPGGGVSTVWEMEDYPSGPKKDFSAHVVFVVDAQHVKYDSANPPPFMKKTSGNEIELWWKIDFKKTDKAIPVAVKLTCKRGALGPTHFAWTVTSVTPGYPKFSADLGVYYHSSGHVCQPKRKGLRP